MLNASLFGRASPNHHGIAFPSAAVLLIFPGLATAFHTDLCEKRSIAERRHPKSHILTVISTPYPVNWRPGDAG